LESSRLFSISDLAEAGLSTEMVPGEL
jgi:hypothetical protein